LDPNWAPILGFETIVDFRQCAYHTHGEHRSSPKDLAPVKALNTQRDGGGGGVCCEKNRFNKINKKK